jgi:hypothetical protein
MSIDAKPVCFSNESEKTSVDCLSGILCVCPHSLKVNFLLLKDGPSVCLFNIFSSSCYVLVFSPHTII